MWRRVKCHVPVATCGAVAKRTPSFLSELAILKDLHMFGLCAMSHTDSKCLLRDTGSFKPLHEPFCVDWLYIQWNMLLLPAYWHLLHDTIRTLVVAMVLPMLLQLGSYVLEQLSQIHKSSKSRSMCMQIDAGSSQVSRHFGLSSSGRLYRASDLIAEHVTSACIRHSAENAAAYVLYTLRTNTLHAFPVQPASDEGRSDIDGGLQGPLAHKPHKHRGARGFLGCMRAAMRPAPSQLSAGGATRALEEGATLIAAPQGKSTVVLQMPRGNLEGALS
jgi:hypothetical protein